MSECLPLSVVYPLFFVGQIIHHKLFDYRGVVVDVDADYCGSEEWYDKMAPTQPPKDKPWYSVLIDGSDDRTYVAERNLEPDDSGDPIAHPDLEDYFIGLAEGIYLSRHAAN